MNESYCKSFGKTQDELIGKSWLTLLPESNREEVRRQYEELARHPVSLEYEHQVTVGDGTTHWQAWSDTPIFDAEGRLLEFQSVGRDITERKLSEEAVMNSEKRFRALIENGRDNISLLAADGTLLWESPSTIHILGYAPDQFVGHNIFELMHPDDMDWTSKPVLAGYPGAGKHLGGRVPPIARRRLMALDPRQQPPTCSVNPTFRRSSLTTATSPTASRRKMR